MDAHLPQVFPGSAEQNIGSPAPAEKEDGNHEEIEKYILLMNQPLHKRPCITFVTFNDDVSLGVRTLHAVLTGAGYRCRIISFQGGRPMEQWFSEDELRLLLDVLAKQDTQVFGLSFRSFFYPVAKKVTEELHRLTSALVVWGGTHPTLMPEQCIATADAVCVGEGEGPVLELMEAVERGADISGIKNLWIRTGEGIARNTVRPLLQDLDSLPWPILGHEDMTAVVGMDVVPGDPVYGKSRSIAYYICGSRGCPFSCDFCCNSALRRIFAQAGPYVRKRTPENIMAELEQAKEKLDIDYVAFRDEVFTMDKSWTMEICRHYRERINIPFTCEVHPNTMDRELAEALTEAGLHAVVMGIQSGSERVMRDVYNRRVSAQNILKSARLLHEKRLEVFYDFIFDNPYETRDDLAESFQVLLQIPRPYTLYIFSMAFFPEAEITNRALKDKLILPEEVAGASEKPLKSFRHEFRYSLNKDHAFYSMLFWLSQLKFSFRHITFYYVGIADEPLPIHIVPIAILKRMEKSEWLARRPERLFAMHKFFMLHLNRLLRPLRWIKSGLQLLARARFSELAQRTRERLTP
jgi:anaerobic magnesium-protoporphyrin IX monomethyl ester cyclase